MSHGYESYLRQLHDMELNLVKGGGGGGLSVCLVYPNRYYVAMSSLGYLSVYRIAGETFGVSVERATLPDDGHLKYLEKAGKSILTIESQRPIKQFDVLLFSISFENDFINVLKILRLSGIPLRSKERDEKSPLIVAGGAATMINPEVLSPFVDFFPLGDGEELLGEVLSKLYELKRSGTPKEEIVDGVSSVSGVYVPRHFRVFYDEKGKIEKYENVVSGEGKVAVRKLRDFSTGDFSSSIVTPKTEFSEMLLVEMGRGCPFSCAFCIAEPIYTPVRMRGTDEIINDVCRGVELTGKVGLMGPAVLSHPDFYKVLDKVRQLKGSVGIPSMRSEMLTDSQIECLADIGVKSITLAPEAGSEGLRKAIGKGIGDDVFFGLIERCVEAGIVNIRLYFLVGIPGETDENIQAVADFAKRVRHIVVSATKGSGKAGKVTVSMTPLVPKPHTPLMWMAMEEPGILNRKIRKIATTLKKAGGITVVYEPPKWSYIQALHSRGDRRVADILEGALRKGGNWKGAMRESAVNPEFYVVREREEDETFPWDFLDYGIDKGRLYQRYLKIR